MSTDDSTNPRMAPPVVPLDPPSAIRVIERLRARLRKAVVGRDGVIDLVIVALIAGGHVLLEDYPGSGKTTLAKALGDCVVDDLPVDRIHAMRRVQFTPDLLPSDVTGTTIFDAVTQRFHFRPGPVFAHVLLADEINRTSPKVQAALLEAMGEGQVTIDNETHRLDDLFFVIATQNPLDLVGTFPLPVAQLDRFLFKIRMTHLSREHELSLLQRLDEVRAGVGDSLPRVTRTEVLAAREAARRHVFVADAIKSALVTFAEATRRDERALQGVSSRSLVSAIPALQAHALLEGRDHVTGHDLEVLAPNLFAHRLVLGPGAGDAADVVRGCLAPAVEKIAWASLKRS